MFKPGRTNREQANPDDDGAGVTPMRFYSYLLQDREGSYLVHYGRLFHQYAVDMYVKVEQQRLRYIEKYQDSFRAEVLQGVLDAMHNETARDIGSRVVLPASFAGGPRDMNARYQDAMAIVRSLGNPDLFITMTCNPKWPEITSALKPGQLATDRPDLTNRVFKLKVRTSSLLFKNSAFADYSFMHLSVISLWMTLPKSMFLER